MVPTADGSTVVIEKSQIIKLKLDSRIHGFFENEGSLFALIESEDNQMTMQAVSVSNGHI